MRKPHLLARTIAILLMAVAFAAGATFLPDNAYQRFQLLDGTVYEKARWIYERLHYDKRPVDVAILGDSHALIGLQPDRIQAQLAAAGKRAEVVNMAMVGQGRNMQWLLVRDLIRTKKPKVLVLAVSSWPSPWGHDSFRYYAPADDIREEATHGLYDVRKNLTYLPFRQLKLFAAFVAPQLFGLRPAFDPKAYDPAQDNWVTPRTSADGKYHDPGKRVPPDILMDQLRSGQGVTPKRSKLPAPIRRFTDADDRVYMDKIAAEAARHGVKIVFTYIPIYHTDDEIQSRRYYQSIGPIQDNQDIAGHDELYMDVYHTNMYGSQIVSDRVAAAVAPLLP